MFELARHSAFLSEITSRGIKFDLEAIELELSKIESGKKLAKMTHFKSLRRRYLGADERFRFPYSFSEKDRISSSMGNGFAYLSAGVNWDTVICSRLEAVFICANRGELELARRLVTSTGQEESIRILEQHPELFPPDVHPTTLKSELVRTIYNNLGGGLRAEFQPRFKGLQTLFPGLHKPVQISYKHDLRLIWNPLSEFVIGVARICDQQVPGSVVGLLPDRFIIEEQTHSKSRGAELNLLVEDLLFSSCLLQTGRVSPL